MSFGGVSKQKVATVIVAADGTGDTTDIQTGIDLLPAIGGVVYIKEGVYTITSTILITSNSVSLKGAGRATKITTTGSVDLLKASNSSYLLLEDILFYGAGDGVVGNYGIVLFQMTDVVMRSCWAENNKSGGVDISVFSPRVIIANCFISDNFDYGIKSMLSDNYIITGNTITGNSGEGIELIASDNANIIGNQINDNGAYGIKLVFGTGADPCDGINISGNQIKGNTSGDIDSTGATNLQLGHNVTS